MAMIANQTANCLDSF